MSYSGVSRRVALDPSPASGLEPLPPAVLGGVFGLRTGVRGRDPGSAECRSARARPRDGLVPAGAGDTRARLARSRRCRERRCNIGCPRHGCARLASSCRAASRPWASGLSTSLCIAAPKGRCPQAVARQVKSSDSSDSSTRVAVTDRGQEEMARTSRSGRSTHDSDQG